MADLARDPSVAYISGLGEVRVPSPVAAVLTALTVLCSVVLLQRFGPGHHEIGSPDEDATGVVDFHLRLDLDLARGVQDPQDGLPGGLGAPVAPAQRLAQPT
ncbi:hypothetical protein ACFX43_11585 [Nocardioides sp. YIM B13467]|uniref:hypothetical protein n=1 Tax=Nocardioides sp. YIM B13467 TaxID=3366294 RepID=UPI00366C1155